MAAAVEMVLLVLLLVAHINIGYTLSFCSLVSTEHFSIHDIQAMRRKTADRMVDGFVSDNFFSYLMNKAIAINL